ncbi:uncharacterized protein LOC142363321 isoform X2 [Opisthocomus hoazin]|uniref:uncharacterized protein LOC142363321 isoform X2 n=1 Tax=Opisthocomus hoazin TaxID=30419 RepID=UPI003F5311D2
MLGLNLRWRSSRCPRGWWGRAGRGTTLDLPALPLAPQGPAMLPAESAFMGGQTQQVQSSARPNPPSRRAPESLRVPGDAPSGQAVPSSFVLYHCRSLLAWIIFFSLTSLQVFFFTSTTRCRVPGGTRSAAHPKPGLPKASPGGDHHHGGYQPGDARRSRLQDWTDFCSFSPGFGCSESRRPPSQHSWVCVSPQWLPAAVGSGPAALAELIWAAFPPPKKTRSLPRIFFFSVPHINVYSRCCCWGTEGTRRGSQLRHHHHPGHWALGGHLHFRVAVKTLRILHRMHRPEPSGVPVPPMQGDPSADPVGDKDRASPPQGSAGTSTSRTSASETILPVPRQREEAARTYNSCSTQDPATKNQHQ